MWLPGSASVDPEEDAVSTLLPTLSSPSRTPHTPPDRTEPGGTQLWRSLCPEAFLYSGGSAGLDACCVNSDSILFLSLLPLSALPGKCRMTCLPDETSLFVQVVSPASNDTPDMLMK